MMSSDALGDAPGDRPAKGHTARLVATLAERTAALETLTKLETGERSRLEAEKFQYEAQANAALAMQRKVAQRAEVERSEWLVEKAALENELQASREALAKAQQEARQRGAEAKKASEQLAEARAEAKRLRAERETLIEQLKGGSSADEDDHLAVREQLAQTVEHASAVNRKMTKAHKTQQNVITQLESEIELLSEKVDQLEDECCSSEESRLCLEGILNPNPNPSPIDPHPHPHPHPHPTLASKGPSLKPSSGSETCKWSSIGRPSASSSSRSGCRTCSTSLRSPTTSSSSSARTSRSSQRS